MFCMNEIPCLGDYVKYWPNESRDHTELVIASNEERTSFLGTAVYAQRFCDGFSTDAAPLFDHLKRQPKKQISWGPTLCRHFQSLKKKISPTPTLAIGNFDRPFHMRKNASDYAYKDAEKNYSIREKELLAILSGLRIGRDYLLDKSFVVETDHKFLESIFTQKSISRSIARWYDGLSEYHISFKYILGEVNSVADGISFVLLREFRLSSKKQLHDTMKPSFYTNFMTSSVMVIQALSERSDWWSNIITGGILVVAQFLGE
ncbi:LOW QUALITY PROTEIN: Retroelement [Phytophthora megakarya]|uniref:Retroelement n=1 Tax=Phytophthora megakarya TaxID=4795 RepID=A0A225UTM2_9STRA|nr:LOW QUALITY PROTEIN: Retroelement [Phytophthora megakarya]